MKLFLLTICFILLASPFVVDAHREQSKDILCQIYPSSSISPSLPEVSVAEPTVTPEASISATLEPTATSTPVPTSTPGVTITQNGTPTPEIILPQAPATGRAE